MHPRTRLLAAATLLRNYFRLAPNDRLQRRAHAGCVAFTGVAASGALALFRSLAHALPRARLFGPDDLTRAAFVPRLGARVGRRVLITWNGLPATAYPPAGQDFFRRYAAGYGDSRPGSLRRLRLRGGADRPRRGRPPRPGRAAVIRRLRAMPLRTGAIGTYRFDRFGDTTLRTFRLYGIRSRALAFAGSVAAP